MGDKTQLLAFLLTVRFKKPWPIIAGILIATILNHWMAAFLGEYAVQYVPLDLQKWLLSSLFLVFGIWILIPDKSEEIKSHGAKGAFWTTVIGFFLAEMGDKTQLATIALAAQYKSVYWVTLGTTLGMMVANVPAVLLGEQILKRIPLKLIRWIAFSMFIAFAIYIVL